MFPLASYGMNVPAPATFVSALSENFDSSGHLVPVQSIGAQVGDIIVYAASSYSAVTLSSPGFTNASQGFGGALAWVGFKVLTSTDIASPPTLTGNGAANVRLLWALYRGANAAAFRPTSSMSTAAAVSVTRAGVGQGAFRAGIVAMAFADSIADVSSFTLPSEMTLRLTDISNPATKSFIADKLVGYAGDSITHGGAVSRNRALLALELIRIP